jgi:hypothetical protein
VRCALPLTVRVAGRRVDRFRDAKALYTASGEQLRGTGFTPSTFREIEGWGCLLEAAPYVVCPSEWRLSALGREVLRS